MSSAAMMAAMALLADGVFPAHNWSTPPQRGERQATIAFYDGNKLLEICEKSADMCAAYVVGVADGQLATIMATSRTRAYCIPTGATIGQVRDVVVKFLRARPDVRHGVASNLVALALYEAWPRC